VGSINYGRVNGVKTKQNAVPPAGQGLPLNTFKQQHSIKPMSRLQLQKYNELMRYKKLMGERNHLRMGKGLSEAGSLRHIAPILADNLVEAPSIRLAALARLIAFAKHRQKMIDVTASKKTLKSRRLPLLSATKMQKYNSSKMASAMMTSANTSPDTPVMTSSQKASAFSFSPINSEEKVTKDIQAVNLPMKPNAVLVPSSKEVLIPSFASVRHHEIEARPAVESSKLLSKTVVVEHSNNIDPSDVTRSRLSKPERPSITQVMSLLGNNNGQSDSKRNVAGATKKNENMATGHDDSGTQVNRQIVKNFFQRPTQPATNIHASFTDLGNLLSGRSPTEQAHKGKKLEEEKPRAGGKSNIANGQVNAVHDEESGISSIRKKNTRNIIRTLKTDTSVANLLLRKRSEIPRIKRRLKKSKRKNKTQ